MQRTEPPRPHVVYCNNEVYSRRFCLCKRPGAQDGARINGLVGATNTAALSRDQESIYGVLKLRFDKRDIKDDANLLKIVTHPAFPIFPCQQVQGVGLGLNKRKASHTHK